MVKSLYKYVYLYILFVSDIFHYNTIQLSPIAIHLFTYFIHSLTSLSYLNIFLMMGLDAELLIEDLNSLLRTAKPEVQKRRSGRER